MIPPTRGTTLAELIPEHLPDGASQGERRAFAALQALPDDVVVYYEPVIARRYPDFIVIAPTLGVIVIEVKGIPLPWITHADDNAIRYTQGGHAHEQAHPSRQALTYQRKLMSACETHPAAADLKGDRYFTFAFGKLAIMTSIRRADLDASPWAALFPRGETLCMDEFDALAGNPAALMAALRAAMPPHVPITPITPARMNTIRSVISPAARVETLPLFGDPPPKLSVDMLDLEQEKVARQLMSGHRILYGVPGSGKTIVLIAAARMLAEAGQSVLVLCFNHTLQRYLEKTLAPHPGVIVRTFGRWASDQGAQANLGDGEAFGAGLLAILQSGDEDAGKYDAVLIDEGQDFHASWFQSAVLALKEPADGTLIIAYDVSQNLYRARLPNWGKVGVKAQGRTKRFTRNYRNTREIVAAAASFGAPEFAGDDDLPQAVALRPENCIRSGPAPALIQCAGLDAQIARSTTIVRDLMASGLAAHEIMLLCLRTTLRDRLKEKFKNQPVTISTIHGARGLQAKAVILVAADDLQNEDGRSLMYVALTRPTDHLHILWSHDTPLVKELARNLDAARA